MKPISAIILTLSLLWTVPCLAETRGPAEAEVLRDFEQILDLWRDGRYSDLYERTDGGGEGQESFASRLASAPRRPACCWEKLQDVKITVKSERAAVVSARLGLEGAASGVQQVTKSIRLKKEEGRWVISQAELLSLARAGKKRTR